MSCEKTTPFAALSELHVEFNDDYYMSKIEIKMPNRKGYATVIDRVAIVAEAFNDFGNDCDALDPNEYVDLKIVSRGKTVIDKRLNTFQVIALFSNHVQSTAAELDGDSINVWDLNKQGAAIVLSQPDDIFSLTMVSGNETDARPISINGYHQKKQKIVSTRLPFIKFSTDDEVERSAELTVSPVGCKNVHITQVVMSGPEHFHEEENEDNFDIDVQSNGFEVFKGQLRAIDLQVLANISRRSHAEPEFNLRVWQFSEPLSIHEPCDKLAVALKDEVDPEESDCSGDDTDTMYIGAVALGYYECWVR